MADTTNPVNTAQNPVQNQPKKQLFGGNQEVFDNLEKFEQLTNPTGEEDLDFAFEDLLDEADPAQSSLEESEYTFPEVNASESNPISANPGDEEFIIPEAEAQSVQPAENVFEAATQAPMQEPETVSQQKEEKSDLDYEVPLADEEETQVFEPLMEEEFSQELLPEHEEETQVFEPLMEEEFSQELLPEHEEEVQLQPEFSPFATVKEAELEAPQQSMMDAPESSISAPETQVLQGAVEDENAEEKSILEAPEDQTATNAELLAHQKLEQEPEGDASKFVQKFLKLLQMTKSIFKFEKDLNKEEILDFELLGSNTQKSMVRYVVNEVPTADQTMLQIKRIEKDYANNSETEHTLHLLTKQEAKNLMVIIDEFPLYEEERDFSDPIKAAIVNEKLNKFDLLLSEKLKPLEKQIAAKKEAEEKEKAFRTVFRDF